MSEDDNLIKSTDFLAWYAVYIALANEEPIAIEIEVDQDVIGVNKTKFAMRKAAWIIVGLALFVLFVLFMKYIGKAAVETGSTMLIGGMI